MSGCGSTSIFDNPKYKDLLSDEKFIEFLISKLEGKGFGGGLPIELVAGNKINILDQSIEDSLYKFTISYLDAIFPLVSIALNLTSIEKGVIIPTNTIEITSTYTRKTYRLKSVNFEGITDALDLGENDLLEVEENQKVTVLGNNSLTIGRLDTQIAEITAVDTNDNVANAIATINRPNRWYWGVTNNSNLNNINIAQAIGTGLGNIPSLISPNVGNGNYVWVATISSFDITDTTLKVSQVEQSTIRQLEPVIGYFVNYNIKRTGLKSGGTINLLIS